MILFYILFFSFAGSMGAVIISGLFLITPEQVQKRLLPVLISYATGTLLGAAFLGIIPHIMETMSPMRVSLTLLMGILIFFGMEKLVIWRHCHTEDCDVHDVSGPMILLGDAFHSFADGVMIAATFLTSIPLGIATSISIISHEIPQEVGDFAILIKSNYSKKKAFGLNIISGLSAVVGALLAYTFMSSVTIITPYIMGIAAGSFIYIAMTDLIPGLHQSRKLIDGVLQIVLILLGMGTIYFFHR